MRELSSRRRLKVLFLTPWYPSAKDPVQGTFVREHAKAVSLRDDVAVLHLAGHDSTSRRSLYEVDRTSDPAARLRIQELRVTYRRPIPKTAYMIYVYSAVAAYFQLVQEGFRPDIIHANIYSAGIPALVIGALCRRPVVVSEHSTAFPDRRLSRLELLKARITFQQARAVLPVSRFLQRAIEAHGLRGSYRLVPNAVDTDIFRPGSHLANPRRKRLLFVGLLKPVKGIPLLLDALAQVPKRLDWMLDVVGDGPNRADYEDLARSFRMGERVRFHGAKSKQEVAQFMSQSSALVMASRTENQPCVILEAMVTGLPVVAPSVGGIPEILDDRSGLLVRPGDPVDLAQAITRILENDSDLQPLEAVQRATDRYSLESVGFILGTLYREFACPNVAAPKPLLDDRS